MQIRAKLCSILSLRAGLGQGLLTLQPLWAKCINPWRQMNASREPAQDRCTTNPIGTALASNWGRPGRKATAECLPTASVVQIWLSNSTARNWIGLPQERDQLGGQGSEPSGSVHSWRSSSSCTKKCWTQLKQTIHRSTPWPVVVVVVVVVV
jgi:hypothetical protein